MTGVGTVTNTITTDYTDGAVAPPPLVQWRQQCTLYVQYVSHHHGTSKQNMSVMLTSLVACFSPRGVRIGDGAATISITLSSFSSWACFWRAKRSNFSFSMCTKPFMVCMYIRTPESKVCVNIKLITACNITPLPQASKTPISHPRRMPCTMCGGAMNSLATAQCISSYIRMYVT